MTLMLCPEPIKLLGPDLRVPKPKIIALPSRPKKNVWGAMIATIRTAQGVSQRQLASKAKVNRSTLRRIEDGETDGDISIFEKLFGFLGYELEALTLEENQERNRRQLAAANNPDEASKIAARALLDLSL